MKTNSDLNPTIKRKPIAQNSHGRWKPILANLLILAALLGSSVTVAFGQSLPDLFTAEVLPSDTEVGDTEGALMERARAQDQQEPTIRRSRHVKINVRGLKVLKTQGSVGLNLFNDVYLIMETKRVDTRGENQYTIHGGVVGVEISGVTIVVENGVIVGNIHANGHSYQIRSIGGGLQAIQEMDASALPKPSQPMIPESNVSQGKKQGPEDIGPGNDQPPVDDEEPDTVIDVMVVYTPAAFRNLPEGTIKALVHLAIDETNEAYANSQIIQRIRLVHLAQVDYTESQDLGTDLRCLTNYNNAEKCMTDANKNAMQQVNFLRNTYGADLVSLWVNDLDESGKGWGSVSAEYGFSVLSWDQAILAGYWSFAHELGHNMGGHHDRLNALDDEGNQEFGEYDYSFGWQDPSGEWRTILSYDCATSYCPRIPYFSNPAVQYNGVSTGVAIGKPNAADNTKTFNLTMSRVASYRPTKVFAPPPIQTPTPESILTQTTVTFNGKLTGNGATEHWLLIGTAEGTSNITNQYMGTTSSLTVSGLPYTGKIYVRYYSKMLQGWVYQDHTYTMNVVDTPPKLIAPAPGSRLSTTTATFRGEHASGDLQHWLYIGTTKGRSNVFSQNMGTNHSISVSGLPQSGTIYVRYWTRFASGWKFQDHAYSIRNFLWDNDGISNFRN